MAILEISQELSGAPKTEPPGAPGAPRSEFPGAPGLAPDPATLGAPGASPELPNPSPYLSDLTDHGVYLGVGGSGEATSNYTKRVPAYKTRTLPLGKR